VLTDVTDRRLAEEALRRNEEYFRSLIENSSDMIAVVDREQHIRYVSPAVERVLGYDTNAWRELPGSSVVHPADVSRSNATFAAALEQPDVPHINELRIRHVDGSWRTLEVTLRNQLDVAGVEGMVINARDVTERKRAEAALRESEELLARAQKMDAIGRLAGGVAHDFNNLLTAIQGHAALLLDELHDSSGIRTDLLEIRDAAERATTLTRQLLAFSRRQVLQPRVLDLNLVVADMEKMLRRMIGEHIELRTELGSPLDLVRADPTQLEQVLLNLIVNARDALPRGGRVCVRTANRSVPEGSPGADPELPPGDYVMLQVEDDGAGMSAQVAEHAFEPFFTTKGPGSGTGLGLSTVYGIVKQSGGHVWLESQPAGGTTVTLYLPRVAEPLELIEHHPVMAAAPKGGSETVLLAEDEKSVRDLAKRILERGGYHVLEASTGREALDVQTAHEGPIHLLLSDVVMPEMNGPELATRVVQLRPDIRVLFMSGYAEEAVAHHGAIAGTHAFMEKPFSPDELLRRVRAVLEEPR
jgi:PAS domain S-box-containing protein